MFNHISFNSILPDSETQKVDLVDIIDKVNTASFAERVLPYGMLQEIIEKITPEKIDKQNCHSITRDLIKYRPDLKVVYGYLIIGKTPRDLNSLYLIVDEFANWIIEGNEKKGLKALADTHREGAWVMKIDPENNRIMLKLFHHSVVLDENGNYIECLPEKYPLNKENKYEYGYVFFPHASAKFLAFKSFKRSSYNIIISCGTQY